MISLSLQSSGHRMVFQHQPVRPSTPCYRGFSLPKDSSLGFWSTASDEFAPFGLAFASAPPYGLSRAGHDDSRTHYAKGMPQPRRAATPCRHTVSGLFHSPDRGSFHLSLAVLVRYRSSPSIRFSCRAFVPCRGPATPRSKLRGLGSCAFARRYLRNLFV